jgi:hypothetical protein
MSAHGKSSRDERFAHLTTCLDPVQRDLIESTLQEAGILYTTQQLNPISVMTLAETPFSQMEFRVTADRLQEAKDALCANILRAAMLGTS